MSLRGLLLALAMFISCVPGLFAQRTSACDSTIVMSGVLPEMMDVRAELGKWIPPNAELRLLFERPLAVNRDAIGRQLVRTYPPQLRNRGIGDEVVFAVRIDTLGKVADRRVLKPSSYQDFNIAAVSIVRTIRYQPFRLDAGCAVPAVLHVPIVFQIRN